MRQKENIRRRTLVLSGCCGGERLSLYLPFTNTLSLPLLPAALSPALPPERYSEPSRTKPYWVAFSSATPEKKPRNKERPRGELNPNGRRFSWRPTWRCEASQIPKELKQSKLNPPTKAYWETFSLASHLAMLSLPLRSVFLRASGNKTNK